MEEILYQKTYPKDDYTELMKESQEDKVIPPMPHLTFDEIMEKIHKDTFGLLLPEKQKYADLFVKEAIQVSELHEIDLKIVRRDFYILAEFYMSCGMELHRHKRLMMLADSLAILNNVQGHDIVFRLEYNTHAIIRRGRQIYPFNFDL